MSADSDAKARRYQLIIDAALRQCQCDLNQSTAFLRTASAEDRARVFGRLANQALAAVRSHATNVQILRCAHFLLQLADVTDQDAEPLPRPKVRPAVRNRIIRVNNATCVYCGRRGTFRSDADGEAWHIDHKQPISRGGSNDESNLTLACRRCNLEKHTATAEEYAGWAEED